MHPLLRDPHLHGDPQEFPSCLSVGDDLAVAVVIHSYLPQSIHGTCRHTSDSLAASFRISRTDRGCRRSSEKQQQIKERVWLGNLRLIQRFASRWTFVWSPRRVVIEWEHEPLSGARRSLIPWSLIRQLTPVESAFDVAIARNVVPISTPIARQHEISPSP